jgi:hypothetical protein
MLACEALIISLDGDGPLLRRIVQPSGLDLAPDLSAVLYAKRVIRITRIRRTNSSLSGWRHLRRLILLIELAESARGTVHRAYEMNITSRSGALIEALRPDDIQKRRTRQLSPSCRFYCEAIRHERCPQIRKVGLN